MGEREKTIEYRFFEACHENKEPKARVYRATRGDYIFGRATREISRESFCQFKFHNIGVWHSLVVRMVRDHEVAGSNPVTPTK